MGHQRRGDVVARMPRPPRRAQVASAARAAAPPAFRDRARRARPRWRAVARQWNARWSTLGSPVAARCRASARIASQRSARRRQIVRSSGDNAVGLGHLRQVGGHPVRVERHRMLHIAAHEAQRAGDHRLGTCVVRRGSSRRSCIRGILDTGARRAAGRVGRTTQIIMILIYYVKAKKRRGVNRAGSLAVCTHWHCLRQAACAAPARGTRTHPVRRAALAKPLSRFAIRAFSLAAPCYAFANTIWPPFSRTWTVSPGP